MLMLLCPGRCVCTVQTDPCTEEAKAGALGGVKKSGLMSGSPTKLFFDKGISGDKCCRDPI